VGSRFIELILCVKRGKAAITERRNVMKTPAWIVREVQPKEDYTLLLTFADGVKKIYDARPLFEKSIYAQLKNPAFFLSAKADCGTVVWNDDIDIAPEHLYERGQVVDNAFRA